MDLFRPGNIRSRTLRHLLGWAAALGVLFAGVGCGPRYTPEELDVTRKWQLIDMPRAPHPLSRELNLLVWENYLAPDVVARFEAEYGVKVNVEHFSENEVLHARVTRPDANYDVIMPGTYMVQQLIREKRLRPLRRDRVPNMRHVDAEYYSLKHDPGLKYSVPFYVAIVGITFNMKYASGLPLTWPEFADETAKKLARGRLAALDEMRTTLGTALLMQGFSPNSRNPAEIARARELLMLVKSETGLVFALDSEADLLAQEEIILGTCWGGDAARALAANGSVRFIVPTGPSISEVDSFCIPTTAPHAETAEFFINFLLTPEIAGALTNYSYYANTCSSSRAFVTPVILNGPAFMKPLPQSAVFLEDVEEAAGHYIAAWQTIQDAPTVEIQKVPLPFPRTQSTVTP